MLIQKQINEKRKRIKQMPIIKQKVNKGGWVNG